MVVQVFVVGEGSKAPAVPLDGALDDGRPAGGGLRQVYPEAAGAHPEGCNGRETPSVLELCNIPRDR